MNLKICPLMGKECQYTDCMLFNKAAAQCSISVIAVELQSVSANTGTIADALAEATDELPNITAAVKGLM